MIDKNLTRLINKQKQRKRINKFSALRGNASQQFWNIRVSSKDSIRSRITGDSNNSSMRSRKGIQKRHSKNAIHIEDALSSSVGVNNSFKKRVIQNQEIFSDRVLYYNSSYVKKFHQRNETYESSTEYIHRGSLPMSPSKDIYTTPKTKLNLDKQLSRKMTKNSQLFNKNSYNKKVYEKIQKNISGPVKNSAKSITRNNFAIRHVMSAGEETNQCERCFSQRRANYSSSQTASGFMSNNVEKQAIQGNSKFAFKSRRGKYRKFKNNFQKKLGYPNFSR
ncbi:unnamed protein product [Moneuplotes crassus]|uniref:Uncharacterized protein n=1 Tax=Euplotes crassus TaxID=5936 RepID=A0AAD1XBN7_EUPCR|nr:unnamed protein product [Moneuplotes crassus]